MACPLKKIYVSRKVCGILADTYVPGLLRGYAFFFTASTNRASMAARGKWARSAPRRIRTLYTA